MWLHREGEGFCTIVWMVCAEPIASPTAAPLFPRSIADFSALLVIVHRLLPQRSQGMRGGDGGASVRGLEPCADERQEVLQLWVVPVFELPLHFVDAVDDRRVVAATETGADLRE